MQRTLNPRKKGQYLPGEPVSGPEEKQQTRHPVKVETAGAAPVGTARFPSRILRSIKVMQRSFKPRKKGQYLPGEPIFKPST